MRIIAGKYRSRILKSLKGSALRPTSDRLRETLFDILGASVEGSRFLDVFAGTGAIGIEALSRGAVEAIFIENHSPSAKLIRRNLDSLGITSGATILTCDALAGLEELAARSTGARANAQGGLALQNAASPDSDHSNRINFVFVDPPYDNHADYARTLEFLGSNSANFLSLDVLVVLEHHHKFSLPESSGHLFRTRLLKQGDASLSFFRSMT